jgi:hypothetical protein
MYFLVPRISHAMMATSLYLLLLHSLLSPNKSILRIHANQTILSLTNFKWKSNNIYTIKWAYSMVYLMLLIRCDKSWQVFLEIRSKFKIFDLRQLYKSIYSGTERGTTWWWDFCPLSSSPASPVVPLL